MRTVAMRTVAMRAVAVLPVSAVAVAAGMAGCGGGERGQNPAAAPAVLAVRVPTDAPSGEHATALALGAGRALTVAHVLRAGRPVFVGPRRARVIRIDRRLDIALLAVPGLRAPEPAGAAARAGQRVTVRVLRDGAIRALPATVRRTITAHLSGNGPVRVRPALELTAAVQPGDSGAPILDDAGRVTGMVFAQATGREDLAYAVDARAVAALLGP
jgi:S1-C subfamily serine protease